MTKIDKNLWLQIQEENPIVHSISNSVTANDTANILLAIGASPIMADEPKEMEDITKISQATVLNIGTPNDAVFQSCLLAGKEANELGHPIVIDPVGVGASDYRKVKMMDLLQHVKPTIIRANLGEVQTLVGLESKARGVDSAEGELENNKHAAETLAKRYNCTVFMTGEEDYITDGKNSYFVSGGNNRIQKITGTGCMLSVICGAISTVTNPNTAAVNAAYAWKICAEITALSTKGIGEMRTSLFDYAEHFTDLIQENHKVTVREGK